MSVNRAPREKDLGDGLTLVVAFLPFVRARDALLVLGRSLGPAVAGFATGKIDLSTLDSEALSALERAFGDVSSVRTPEGRTLSLSDSAACEALFGGGRLDRYVAWMQFAVEVNFSDFFGFVRARLADVARARPAKPPTP